MCREQKGVQVKMVSGLAHGPFLRNSRFKLYKPSTMESDPVLISLGNGESGCWIGSEQTFRT